MYSIYAKDTGLSEDPSGGFALLDLFLDLESSCPPPIAVAATFRSCVRLFRVVPMENKQTIRYT